MSFAQLLSDRFYGNCAQLCCTYSMYYIGGPLIHLIMIQAVNIMISHGSYLSDCVHHRNHQHCWAPSKSLGCFHSRVQIKRPFVIFARINVMSAIFRVDNIPPHPHDRRRRLFNKVTPRTTRSFIWLDDENRKIMSRLEALYGLRRPSPLIVNCVDMRI